MIHFSKYFWLAFIGFIIIAFLSVKIAFLFFGMYFLFIALFLKYQYYQLKNWTQVEGTILEKRIEENGIGARGETLYIAYVKYVYMLDQKKNYSSEISLFKNDFFTPDNRELKKRLKKIKRDTIVPVYIDPSKTKSVLLIEMCSGARFYFYCNFLLGLTVVITGLMMEL